MELGWEEKKLRALFSELKAADERSAPRFARVWNRAQVAPRRIRAFNPAFAGATALLVCALVSLAIWSRYSQQTQPPTVAVVKPASPNTTITVTDNSGNQSTPRVKPNDAISTSRANKPTVRRNILLARNRKLTRDAKAITSWESPTTALLSSPSDEVFGSLPTLDQGASDLKSFLPK